MSINFYKPWLRSSKFDCVFILLPSVISVLIVYLLSHNYGNTGSVPLWIWLLFILGIDVSHVYSTLFRTYFNSDEVVENKIVFTLIPILVWLLGVALYAIQDILFWRVLSYIAVFHFIRQQYGLMRLYTKDEHVDNKDKWLSTLIIYMATLYPIIFWHSHQQRNFHWFVEGDFITGLPVWISSLTGLIYILIILFYFSNELLKVKNKGRFNLPKNLVIFGSMFSWYMGIVHFNGDMEFTITNVVSHGIPYMALVWIYGEKQKDKKNSTLILNRFSFKIFFSKYSFPLYLGLLLILGYIEEGLWDGLIWRQHLEAFSVFSFFPQITAKDTLTWLVPLLTLPQATHYVLDGFIWKVKDSSANWQKVFFARKMGIE